MSKQSSTMKDKKLLKEAKQFAAFITDVAEAMKKHNVGDMLCIFYLNGEIRNTYIPLDERGEDPLLCHISDGIHQSLLRAGIKKSGNPKHTTPLTLNNQS